MGPASVVNDFSLLTMSPGKMGLGIPGFITGAVAGLCKDWEWAGGAPATVGWGVVGAGIPNFLRSRGQSYTTENCPHAQGRCAWGPHRTDPPTTFLLLFSHSKLSSNYTSRSWPQGLCTALLSLS